MNAGRAIARTLVAAAVTVLLAVGSASFTVASVGSDAAELAIAASAIAASL